MSLLCVQMLPKNILAVSFCSGEFKRGGTQKLSRPFIVGIFGLDQKQAAPGDSSDPEAATAPAAVPKSFDCSLAMHSSIIIKC